MSYVTAVTNHTASGYFNVADWTRIYGNALEANSAFTTAVGTTVAFTAVTAPTTSTDPTTILAKFNSLLANIELLRVASVTFLPTLTTEIKDDYIAGAGEETLDYYDVNLWESTIDYIYQNITTHAVRAQYPRCGIATCGSGRMSQNSWRGA